MNNDKNNDKKKIDKTTDSTVESNAADMQQTDGTIGNSDIDSQVDFIPGETISEDEKKQRLAQLEAEIKQTAENLKEKPETPTELSPSSFDAPSSPIIEEDDDVESRIDSAVSQEQQRAVAELRARRERIRQKNEGFSDLELAEPDESNAQEKLICLNCKTPLNGPYCHECGQPVRHFIRFFPKVLWEMVNEAFDLDSKIFRTLMPLFFRPGRLTMEYIAGRRARYVNPLRLYIIVSIVFFISISVFSDFQNQIAGVSPSQNADGLNEGVKSSTEISNDETEPDKTVEQSKSRGGIIQFDLGDSKKDAELRFKEAQKVLARLKQNQAEGKPIPDIMIRKFEEALADGKLEPTELSTLELNDDDLKVTLDDGSDWHPQNNPLKFNDWFSPEDTQVLNNFLWELKNKAKKANQDPADFIEEVFNFIPQLMFLLLPLFALLLKVMYFFKKRYYMEHLIVALHSHSFMFFSGILIIVLSFALEHVESTQWLVDTISFLIFVIGFWIPINLFMQQKRIYAQGKFMTTIKFMIIGFSYQLLLLMTTLSALVLGLVAI